MLVIRYFVTFGFELSEKHEQIHHYITDYY